MMNKPHAEWKGFTEVLDNGKRKAKCHICGYMMTNLWSQKMKNHRIACERKKNLPSQSPSTSSARPVQNEEQHETEAEDHTPAKVAKHNCTGVPADVKNKKYPSTQKSLDKLILLYFLSNNLDWSQVSDKYFVDFVQTLNCKYDIPTVTQLNDNILNSVWDELCSVKDSATVFLLSVYTDVIDKFTYCISYINDGKRKTYTDFTKVPSHDFKVSDLEQFIITSLNKLFNVYEIKIEYVLLQSSINISYALIWNEGKVYVYQSIYTLINILQQNNMCTSELSIALNTVKSKLEKPHYLSECVEEIFSIVEKNLIDSSMRKNINEFLCPIALSANLFDHLIKGKTFLKFDSYTKNVCNFLYSAMPVAALSGWSDYKDNSGVFLEIEYEQYDKERFWHIVALKNRELRELTNFALKMLHLPTNIKNIDIDDMKRFEICVGRHDALAISVLASSILNK